VWLRLIDESSDRYEAGVGSAGKTSRRSNQGLEDRARTYTNSYQPRGPVPEALRGHNKLWLRKSYRVGPR
jgi:hypothetical protein